MFTTESVPMLYREALSSSLDYAIEHHQRVVVLGEDVGFYGGNYKVAYGLYRHTHRSVAGMALMGLRPVGEIMTANFSMMAMSGGKPVLSLVVRMPQGVAKQLAAQHSQSLEHLYASSLSCHSLRHWNGRPCYLLRACNAL